jgi:hypothetical protein
MKIYIRQSSFAIWAEKYEDLFNHCIPGAADTGQKNFHRFMHPRSIQSSQTKPNASHKKVILTYIHYANVAVAIVQLIFLLANVLHNFRLY